MRSYKPKQRTAVVVSVPAPTGGINDTDNIANMDPMFAIDMLNMFPSDRSLRVRNGYREWVTGLSGDAKTLMSYNAFTGSDKLFAATDAGIYDVTTQGPAGATVSSLTNGSLSWVNYANIAGQYLVAVNGVDAGKLYNGTTWIDFTTVVTPVNPGEVSGADMDDMMCVHAHKKRLWFVEKQSMTAWYLPTDAVAGAMTAFQLGGVFLRGGFLQNIFTWSMDAGDGLDDILVFQSSKGELAGYSGTDPSTAATFALESVYFVGAPLGTRTNTDLGGDVAILTVNGITPISKIVGGTQAISNSEDALTKNISRTFNDFVRSRAYSPQWEMVNIPSLTYLMVNFPDQNGVGSVQFIMNTLSGAWTKYDLPMVTMVEHSELLYFSDTSSRILVYDTDSNLDNIALDGSGGQFINSSVIMSHNYFQMRGTKKSFNMVRPLFVSSLYPSMSLGVGTDFRPVVLGDLVDPPSNIELSGQWDSAIWDTSIWIPQVDTQYQWVGVTGVGYTGSLSMRLRTTIETEFISTDWVINQSSSL